MHTFKDKFFFICLLAFFGMSVSRVLGDAWWHGFLIGGSVALFMCVFDKLAEDYHLWMNNSDPNGR